MNRIITIKIRPSFVQGLELRLLREWDANDQDTFWMELDRDDMPAAPVARSDAEPVLATLRVLAICPLADVACGLDGTTTRLTIGDTFSEACFEWWCELPRQWEPLRPLFAEMEKLARKTYPNYDIKFSADGDVNV